MAAEIPRKVLPWSCFIFLLGMLLLAKSVPGGFTTTSSALLLLQPSTAVLIWSLWEIPGWGGKGGGRAELNWGMEVALALPYLQALCSLREVKQSGQGRYSETDSEEPHPVQPTPGKVLPDKQPAQ